MDPANFCGSKLFSRWSIFQHRGESKHITVLGTFSQHSKEKDICDVVRIGSITIFYLSKLWKARFFMLCDGILYFWGCRRSLETVIPVGSERRAGVHCSRRDANVEHSRLNLISTFNGTWRWRECIFLGAHLRTHSAVSNKIILSDSSDFVVAAVLKWATTYQSPKIDFILWPAPVG